jgi:isopentenyl-diphosphate delta-isomerase
MVMERIIIVDENDNFIREEEKEKCHDHDGILHRGFLVTLFNKRGELLLAQRSGKKRLWPGYWDGTVASHVFKGENYVQASKRRVEQEVGIRADTIIKFLFKFHYKVNYKNLGTEHEICAVMLVNNVEIDRLSPNENEVSAIKSINPQKLSNEISTNKNRYTPWLILTIEHMKNHQLI